MYICASNGIPLSAQCPKCFVKEAYRINAIVDVGALILLGICVECKYSLRLPELQLNKKVIYLDQLFISNLAKCASDSLKFDERFTLLNTIISSLVKQQLAVFPTSWFHEQETSYVSDINQRHFIQKIAEMYSAGTRFECPDVIIETVLMLGKQGLSAEVDSVLRGNRKNWYSLRYRASVSAEYTNGSFRKEGVLKIHKRLKLENRSFEEILNELVDEYFNNFLSHHVRIALVNNSILKENSIFRIQASLLSVCSKRVAGGANKIIDEGFALDILMIAHILPYVDAIFVDNRMHGFLSESEELRQYRSRIYSLGGISESQNDSVVFIDFLKSIQNNDPEYSCPPFMFKHSQLVQACDARPDAMSPLQQLQRMS